MSFSSAPGSNGLKERNFSFSGDVPGSLYDESDVPHHAEDVKLPRGFSLDYDMDMKAFVLVPNITY
uniref:Predicted protein n=1 Tax=Hordeum vulgare subsp. vulgare TaxID=112509 RepID=F2DTU4_HORVV|nr:predicted protein [Hordeum vulgare subsp. vulgare]